MGYTWIPLFTPKPNSNPDIVDKLVVFNTVLGPFGIRRKTSGKFFLGLCDGKEIGTDATSFDDFIGNAVVAKFEMAGWFIKGRIDNRVLDNNLAQYVFPCFRWTRYSVKPIGDPHADASTDEKIRRAKNRYIHIFGLSISARTSLASIP